MEAGTFSCLATAQGPRSCAGGQYPDAVGADGCAHAAVIIIVAMTPATRCARTSRGYAANLSIVGQADEVQWRGAEAVTRAARWAAVPPAPWVREVWRAPTAGATTDR